MISPDREAHGLLVLEDGAPRDVRVDVVFPVLYGRSGEDGAVQGLLELSGIPYVGCGIQSSAICMDKSLAYLVARSAGIDTPQLSILVGGEAAPSDLAYPVFVKPARSGSSFGVSKVEHAGELAPRSPPHGSTTNAVVTVPANLPEAQRERIRGTARAIYRALGCQGLARVDVSLQEDGRIVLNEVNTTPGFTTYSRYPRMMADAGIPLSEVIDRCISLATAR